MAEQDLLTEAEIKVAKAKGERAEGKFSISKAIARAQDQKNRIIKEGGSMAKISITYHCGCGFKTPSLTEAVLHSDETGHTLTVVGEVVGDNKKKEK